MESRVVSVQSTAMKMAPRALLKSIPRVEKLLGKKFDASDIAAATAEIVDGSNPPVLLRPSSSACEQRLFLERRRFMDSVNESESDRGLVQPHPRVAFWPEGTNVDPLFGTLQKTPGSGSGYSRYYPQLFSRFSSCSPRFLQIGFEMVENLKMWLKYFRNRRFSLFAISPHVPPKDLVSLSSDPEEQSRFHMDRLGDHNYTLRTVYSSLGSLGLLNPLEQMGKSPLPEVFDVVVDAETQIPWAQVRLFELLFPLVKPGGM